MLEDHNQAPNKNKLQPPHVPIEPSNPYPIGLPEEFLPDHQDFFPPHRLMFLKQDIDDIKQYKVSLIIYVFAIKLVQLFGSMKQFY